MIEGRGNDLLNVLFLCAGFSVLWAVASSLPFPFDAAAFELYPTFVGTVCGGVYGLLLGIFVASYKLDIRRVLFQVLIVGIIFGTIGGGLAFRVDIRERGGERTLLEQLVDAARGAFLWSHIGAFLAVLFLGNFRKSP
jgi:hypothetical protein